MDWVSCAAPRALVRLVWGSLLCFASAQDDAVPVEPAGEPGEGLDGVIDVLSGAHGGDHQLRLPAGREGLWQHQGGRRLHQEAPWGAARSGATAHADHASSSAGHDDRAGDTLQHRLFHTGARHLLRPPSPAPFPPPSLTLRRPHPTYRRASFSCAKPTASLERGRPSRAMGRRACRRSASSGTTPRSRSSA